MNEWINQSVSQSINIRYKWQSHSDSVATTRSTSPKSMSGRCRSTAGDMCGCGMRSSIAESTPATPPALPLLLLVLESSSYDAISLVDMMRFSAIRFSVALSFTLITLSPLATCQCSNSKQYSLGRDNNDMLLRTYATYKLRSLQINSVKTTKTSKHFYNADILHTFTAQKNDWQQYVIARSSQLHISRQPN